MNERIRELAQQAGVDFGSVTQDYFGERFPAITSTEKIDFEKFAELIVKECYLWAKENGGLGCEEDFEALKEHFGVE